MLLIRSKSKFVDMRTLCQHIYSRMNPSHFTYQVVAEHKEGRAVEKQHFQAVELVVDQAVEIVVDSPVVTAVLADSLVIEVDSRVAEEDSQVVEVGNQLAVLDSYLAALYDDVSDACFEPYPTT